MAITPELTKHVAELARLSLSKEEQAQFTEELSGILAYVEQIKALDTEGVEPMIYPLPIEATMRDDVVEESLSQSEALANAPQIHLGMFRVPRIIEEE
jgi:aspartyl-tRNA(Asn)/glutamyl-tRNA(Gln) amidotransferase subunit C